MNRSRSRRPRSFFRPGLELLEDRLAPAVLVNPTTVIYPDVDGDIVTVHVSKGTLTADNFTFNSPFNFNGPQQLQTITLRGAQFQGANLTITAVRSPVNGGDGFVNVGEIDATGVDLGAVSVQGDLGKILAGDGSAKTPALALLTVQSLGLFNTSTGAPNNDSEIVGRLGTLTVKSDLLGLVNVTGGAAGSIGQVVVGGSLLGGVAGFSPSGFIPGGFIEASGNIGSVLIKGDVVGSDVTSSGQVQALGSIGAITVGGSVLGGSGDSTGDLVCDGSMGPVTIGGNLLGGNGLASGLIDGLGGLARLSIGGSVLGGLGIASGRIISGRNLGPVTIAGDLQGGDLTDTGEIEAVGSLASVTIGGSVIGGKDFESGAIVSGSGNSGPIWIKGNLVGGTGDKSGVVDVTTNLARLTVGGSVLGGAGDTSGSI
jgi:hypothetical protein